MPTLRNYINNSIGRSYNKTAGGMLTTIKALATAPGSRMQRRLLSLEDEARRLLEDDDNFTPTNAEIIAVMSEIDILFQQTEGIILAHDNEIQATALPIGNAATLATFALTLKPNLLPAGTDPMTPQAQKLYNELLLESGISWTGIDNSLFNATSNYVDSAAWTTKMEHWGAGTAELIRDSIYRGIGRNRTPIGMARDIRHIVENMPTYASERLTRTLQLTSLRDVERISAIANQDYIEYKVRRAVRDLRTCLSCIDLDGTHLQPRERVDDHMSGRCFPTYVLKNGMGDHNQTGAEWFNSLSEARQSQQLSFAGNQAKFRAWQDGAFKLSDVTGYSEHDVFGQQTYEKSLKAILGADRAKAYYKR